MHDAVAAVMALGHSHVIWDWVDESVVKSGSDKVIGVGGWESRKFGWDARYGKGEWR